MDELTYLRMSQIFLKVQFIVFNGLIMDASMVSYLLFNHGVTIAQWHTGRTLLCNSV